MLELNKDRLRSETRTSGRNLSIEGLRGLAAATVMLFHVYMMGSKVGLYPTSANPEVRRVLILIGPFGVCLFFCISGYLIVQSLLKHGNVRIFFRNRLARIYPVFLILHLLMYALGPWVGYDWMGQLRHAPLKYIESFFANLIFLPGLFAIPIAQKNAWSLSLEAAFYIAAAGIYGGVASRGGSKLAALAMGAIGLVLAVTVLALEPFAWFFLVGVGCFWLDGQGILTRLPGLGGLTGLLCLVLSAMAFPYTVIGSLVFASGFFAAVVSQRGWFSALLRQRPFTFLGRISYSLYLIHPFVLDPMRSLMHHLAGRVGAGAASVLFAVVAAPAAVFVANLSFNLIEVKLTRILFPSRKKLDGHLPPEPIRPPTESLVTHAA